MKYIMSKLITPLQFSYISFVLLILNSVSLFAQQTGAVSVSPDTVPPFESAMLDIKSDSKGLIIPRVASLTDLDNISNPATGLLVFLTEEGLECYKFYDGSQWKTLSFVGENYNGKVAPLGAVIMYCGPLENNDNTNYFDATGKGIVDTDFEGWAVCNGKNGTPDLRGYFIVAGGAAPVNGDAELFSKIGNKGGSDSFTITKEQMPKHKHDMSNSNVTASHSHSIFDPGHIHKIPSSCSSSNEISKVKRRGAKNEQNPANTNSGGSLQSLKISNASVNIAVSFSGGDNTGLAGQGQSIDNRPAYNVVMYIMKIDETINNTYNNLRGPYNFLNE